MHQFFSTSYVKSLLAPKPVKKCTVGNYIVYAFLRVNPERAVDRGVLPPLRESVGSGLQKEENPENLLDLDKHKLHMSEWELAGAAIS